MTKTKVVDNCSRDTLINIIKAIPNFQSAEINWKEKFVLVYFDNIHCKQYSFDELGYYEV